MFMALESQKYDLKIEACNSQQKARDREGASHLQVATLEI